MRLADLITESLAALPDHIPDREFDKWGILAGALAALDEHLVEAYLAIREIVHDDSPILEEKASLEAIDLIESLKPNDPAIKKAAQAIRAAYRAGGDGSAAYRAWSDFWCVWRGEDDLDTPCDEQEVQELLEQLDRPGSRLPL